MAKEARFDIGDKVRVVSAMSNFWWWTGEVTNVFAGDLMTDQTHYMIKMDGVPFDMRLLFHETWLAYARD